MGNFLENMSGESLVFDDKFEKFKDTTGDRLKSIENGMELILKKLSNIKYLI